MKILNSNSDFAKRIEEVFQFMNEQGVSIEILCNEIRLSNVQEPDKEAQQNMVLIDGDSGHAITELPPTFEYKLKVFDS